MVQVEGFSVHKKILPNKLAVLVLPVHRVPKVIVELWYGVGSRNELSGQKGLAHLVEHMIFKGTDRFAESDISAATTKLSGSCNAFTSHDYTGYIFEFPVQHWHHAFDMLANCMSNCTFKSDLLNSELKAVVQELKMYRDDYTSSIADELVQAMFVGHPYHYPVVGYKNDLCLITPQTLHGFYQQYYVPNNATLVVVGDVNPQDVFEKAALYFGFLSEGPEIIQPAIPWERDFVSKTTTLYRDIQAPIVQCAFAVPGMRSRLSYTVDILSWIIGSGRGSRLYKLLVDKLNIATAVDSFCYDLFDYSLFFVQIQPKTRQNITEIIQQVKEVMRDLIAQGATVTELERAQVKETASYLTLFEDNQKLADAVGKSYLATHDEQFIFNYCNVTTEQLRVNITEILTHWLNPECMNIGYVLPIEERDKKQWQYLQQQSDALDDTLLSNKTRVTELEQLRYTPTVQIQKFSPFVYPHYRSFTLAMVLKYYIW